MRTLCRKLTVMSNTAGKWGVAYYMLTKYWPHIFKDTTKKPPYVGTFSNVSHWINRLLQVGPMYSMWSYPHSPALCRLDMSLSWPSASLWRPTSSAWGSSSTTPTWAAWTWRVRSSPWRKSSSTLRRTMKMWVGWHSTCKANSEILKMWFEKSISL